MVSSHTPASTPICPKCGYDQSGEIATWEDQCPLVGQCPECGLEFEWANVMDPSRVDLPWYVEHAKRLFGVVRRTPATIKKLIFPNIFWREIGVDTRIRFSYLAIWLFLMFAFFHVLAAVPVGMGGWRNQGNGVGGFGIRGYIDRHGLRCVPEEMFNAIALPFAHFDYSGVWHQFAWGDFGMEMLIGLFVFTGVFVGLTSSWLVVLLALPVSRSMIQLRTAHLIRSWMVTSVVLILNVELFRAVSGIVVWLNGAWVVRYWAFSFLGFVIFSVVWIQWFWVAALKVGWGIRPVWLIGTLGVIASLLAGFVPIMYAMAYV
ncbi:MAG: hypothetical protein ACWA5W_04155 [Phycisphaerales bacterium]